MSQAKTIKEQIEFLKQLQILDREIYTLRSEKDDLPKKIKAIEEILEDKKTGIKQAEENLKALQLKLKTNEVSLQQKEEQIKKLEGQLFQLKTNKEYSSMLTEIGSIKADKSIIEEEILKLMDGIEEAKVKITKEKDVFKKEESVSQKQKAEVDARLKVIEASLKDLDTKRRNITPDIDKATLDRYEKILENKDGLALAQVVNGACEGCHIGLPPQVVSEARLKEDIIICGSCSRILYSDENDEIS